MESVPPHAHRGIPPLWVHETYVHLHLKGRLDTGAQTRLNGFQVTENKFISAKQINEIVDACHAHQEYVRYHTAQSCIIGSRLHDQKYHQTANNVQKHLFL